jgi:hypothetical protein
MATITLAQAAGPAGTFVRGMDNAKLPTVIWKEIDLAVAAAAKGSALAAADVIETVRVPAGSVVIGGWAQKTTAFTGTVSVATLNIGITGVNATEYGSGWDVFAATAGSYSTPTATTPRVVAVSDTVDITIATLTGSLTGGKILVGVMVVDATVDARGNIAQPKS